MEDRVKDKAKIQEILVEIDNLKKYSSDLSNNTRGDKLENLINNLNKNITLFNNKTEEIYDKNFLKDIEN